MQFPVFIMHSQRAYISRLAAPVADRLARAGNGVKQHTFSHIGITNDRNADRAFYLFSHSASATLIFWHSSRRNNTLVPLSLISTGSFIGARRTIRTRAPGVKPICNILVLWALDPVISMICISCCSATESSEICLSKMQRPHN